MKSTGNNQKREELNIQLFFLLFVIFVGILSSRGWKVYRKRGEIMYKIRNIGWILLVAIMILLTACNQKPNAAPEPPKQTQGQTQEQPKNEQPQNQTDSLEGQSPTALEAAATVMKTLKDGDMNTLASWASGKGVRFSPYANVNTKEDIVLTGDELKGLMQDSTIREWGTFAGSGEPIKMTYVEYHKKFVYDADFIKDAKITVNEVVGKSTTINNLNEVYPKDSYDFVEYHIAGIDPAVEGMDWRSLRLVFEKIGDDHILAGIIHDQWTP